jgi:hypothetical protein
MCECNCQDQPVNIKQLKRVLDSISVALQGDVIMNGNTELTPKWSVPVDIQAGGDTDLVAAVSGKKIRVLSAYIYATGAVNLYMKRNTQQITPTIFCTGAKDIVMPFTPLGICETDPGQILKLTTANQAVGVHVTAFVQYVEI